ncbi:hypothetical protein HK102_002436, partial [Quaeritorhiza haematococci]
FQLATPLLAMKDGKVSPEGVHIPPGWVPMPTPELPSASDTPIDPPAQWPPPSTTHVHATVDPSAQLPASTGGGPSGCADQPLT